MSVGELESAASQLSSEELARFSSWYESFMAEKWDREIEQDIETGQLDSAGKRADQDFEFGRCTPL
jgi:hypothetical protein